MQRDLCLTEAAAMSLFSEIAAGGRYLLEHHLSDLMHKKHEGLIRRMDLDKDGLVGFTDFLEFCIRKPANISSMSTSCLSHRSIEKKNCSPLRLDTPVRQSSPVKK